MYFDFLNDFKSNRLKNSVVDPNTLNLDPDLDPGFWPNLDPDPGWIQVEPQKMAKNVYLGVNGFYSFK